MAKVPHHVHVCHICHHDCTWEAHRDMPDDGHPGDCDKPEEFICEGCEQALQAQREIEEKYGRDH